MAVGIQSSGGKVIKDATATPDDVRSKRVFYNNDGRRVGASNMYDSFVINAPVGNYQTIETIIPDQTAWVGYLGMGNNSTLTDEYHYLYVQQENRSKYYAFISYDINISIEKIEKIVFTTPLLRSNVLMMRLRRTTQSVVLNLHDKASISKNDDGLVFTIVNGILTKIIYAGRVETKEVNVVNSLEIVYKKE